MLSAIAPKACDWAVNPDTPENIAPKILIFFSLNSYASFNALITGFCYRFDFFEWNGHTSRIHLSFTICQRDPGNDRLDPGGVFYRFSRECLWCDREII